MKILFVIGSPIPFPSASWARIGFFAEDWSEKNHSVMVLGTFSYKSLQKRGVRKIDKANIFNLIFQMGLNHPFVFTLNSISSFVVSTLFLLVKKPSVTVVSVPSGDVGLGALMACKLLKAKCVIDYRDEWEDYAISVTNSRIEKSFYSAIKKLMTRIYAKCHRIVTVTSRFTKSLKCRGIVNVRLVPNGADTGVFKPSSDRKENRYFTIFYSGHIGEYYRLDVAVKSIKKLVDRGLRNIELVIAGQGEVQKVLNLTLELEVQNNIEYKGEINDKTKLAELIAEADVGLIPYDDNPLWKNSIPSKFYEYCACNIPVVATTYEDSLLARFVREYDIGVISPPMDEQKLAEAIYEIYENKSFREAAGKRARMLIEEKFDRSKIAEELLKLIEPRNWNAFSNKQERSY